MPQAVSGIAKMLLLTKLICANLFYRRKVSKRGKGRRYEREGRGEGRGELYISLGGRT